MITYIHCVRFSTLYRKYIYILSLYIHRTRLNRAQLFHYITGTKEEVFTYWHMYLNRSLYIWSSWLTNLSQNALQNLRIFFTSIILIFTIYIFYLLIINLFCRRDWQPSPARRQLHLHHQDHRRGRGGPRRPPARKRHHHARQRRVRDRGAAQRSRGRA